MSIFNWIGTLLSGETKADNVESRGSQEPQEKHEYEKKKVSDAIDERLTIKNATLSLLDSLYLTESEGCKTRRLAVWLDTDSTTFGAYSGFEQDLMDFWSVERGYDFESVELKQGKPETGGRKVDADFEGMTIYIQEQRKEDAAAAEQVVSKAARVSILGEKGSLLQDQYELSNEELAKEHRKFYNIGRGMSWQMGNGGYRQNHIVIDDKNNLETNQYVSRAHARIGFSERIGFYLQVEYGGSRLSGNRTRLFRNEEIIEVENEQIKVPLQSGDLIELGKAVLLQFVEVR